ncbi:MAG: ECF-type sigma factor [Planctomycetota bacterium]
MEHEVADITTLLHQASGGQKQAFNELIRTVYDRLRHIAKNQMHRQFNRQSLAGLTQQPTDIVHDAVMKIADQHTAFENRRHFFAIATKVIIRVTTDYQRARLAAKRGAGDRGQALPRQELSDPSPDVGWRLEIVERLQLLEHDDPRAAEAFVLRVVLGESVRDVARMLDVSVATAERDLRYARAFFRSHEPDRGD